MKSAKTPPILDPMSGARMFYFDKDHQSVLFGDIRDEDHWMTNYKKLEIHPDEVMDARAIPYPDSSFHLVVLDPPHLIYCGKTSDMAKAYGVLDKKWHEDMRRIFNEAWRVLKPNGTLIFKWADKDVSLAELLYVLPQAPVFGDKKQANNKSGTNRYWLVFFKHEDDKKQNPEEAK